VIEALELTRRFGRRTVVDRLSFQVGRGEVCDALRDVWGEYEEPASF